MAVLIAAGYCRGSTKVVIGKFRDCTTLAETYRIIAYFKPSGKHVCQELEYKYKFCLSDGLQQLFIEVPIDIVYEWCEYNDLEIIDQRLKDLIDTRTMQPQETKLNIKEYKESKMFWKTRKEYAEECKSLKQELRTVEVCFKERDATVKSLQSEINEYNHQATLNASAHSHQLKKLEQKLAMALDGSELTKLQKQSDADKKEIEDLKKYVKHLEEKAMFHDIDVTSYERHIKLLQEELVAVKSRNKNIHEELIAVDGLAKTREIIEIVKELKDNGEMTLEKMLKAVDSIKGK